MIARLVAAAVLSLALAVPLIDAPAKDGVTEKTFLAADLFATGIR